MQSRFLQVAVGKRPHVNVFGNDYDTPDGTGVRDYLHVVDCAQGHLAALKHMEKGPIGIDVLNLGTGRGYSVLEMIEAMKKASGKEVRLFYCLILLGLVRGFDLWNGSMVVALGFVGVAHLLCQHSCHM